MAESRDLVLEAGAVALLDDRGCDEDEEVALVALGQFFLEEVVASEDYKASAIGEAQEKACQQLVAALLAKVTTLE